MAASRRKKWPIIGWSSFTSPNHLPAPFPGFSAEASDDIRCIARLLEDVDKLVLDTLIAEKDISGEIITELKSKVHEHSDADLWAYFADGRQYQWKMAFDVLLLLLGTSAGTNSYAYGRGKVKAFEFALALPDMVEKAHESCQLSPVVKYRLLMKADTLHSFLDTAETTLRDRYLYELNKRNNTTSDRNVKFIRFPTKDTPMPRYTGEISIAKPSTITALVCITSLICTTLQLLSFTSTPATSPLEPAPYHGAELLSIIQQFLMQSLGLFTLLAPALSSPRDQSTWTWTLSGSSFLLACATIPVYLLFGNASSALLSCFASVMQTFVILQIVLKGADTGQAKKEKEHVE